MVRIVNFAHFFKEKRSVMDLNGELPQRVNNFPKDGSVMLSISNETGDRKAFKLTIDEASRLVLALGEFVKRHDQELSKLWDNR